MRKALNAIKKEQFPWMLEAAKCAPQLAIKNDLNSAYRNCFRGLKQGKPAGRPKFHKKGADDSFALSSDQFRVKNKSVEIPKLGWAGLAEKLRLDGEILNAAISGTADEWFIALQIEMPDIEIPVRENQAAGVDLGAGRLAALSDKTEVAGSKASRKYEKQLKRLNQSSARKAGTEKSERKPGNFKKAKAKPSRLYAKMADLRNDETHKPTAMIAQSCTLAGIENLNVQGMAGSRKLARSAADMGFFEFRRQLECKAGAIGAKIVVADRWHPSSKKCSACGAVKPKDEPASATRACKCDCGFICDGDVNAEINLRNYALQHA
ncbi:MAG: transposase [Clostridiales bacterium]|nr:transposase [Clostridiales bacterium]